MTEYLRTAVLLLREKRPNYIVRLTFMAHFHITAVFETKGASQAEAERVAAAAFPGLRHPRLHYYEHETSGGLGPYAPSRSLYFTTIVELDAEAYTEEKAVEMAEDILDRFSTDEIQYLGHGITPGNQRVKPEDRKTREEERRTSTALDEETDEREEQRGKGRRSSRGRGRGRKTGRREKESSVDTEERTTETGREAGGEIPVSASSDENLAARESSPLVQPPVRTARETAVPPVSPIVEEPAPPPSPPPRSSAVMQVTLTVDIRASEVAQSHDHVATVDDELIMLAAAEARRRHPELPTDVTPDSATSALPGGDRLISLTWRYQSPVPSAAELG